ncbi:uncharacterized protein ACBT44_003431 isoform 8-T11 [Syngnathus typhle]
MATLQSSHGFMRHFQTSELRLERRPALPSIRHWCPSWRIFTTFEELCLCTSDWLLPLYSKGGKSRARKCKTCHSLSSTQPEESSAVWITVRS